MVEGEGERVWYTVLCGGREEGKEGGQRFYTFSEALATSRPQLL